MPCKHQVGKRSVVAWTVARVEIFVRVGFAMIGYQA